MYFIIEYNAQDPVFKDKQKQRMKEICQHRYKVDNALSLKKKQIILNMYRNNYAF